MIKVIAIDDEPLALRQLEMYLSRIPDMELIASCSGAGSARPFLDQADALFLDINMPDTSGMELIRSLDNPPLVVFTTAYPQYAVEGFRVNAVDYLLKPFSFKEFCEACDKLRGRLQLKDTILRFKADYKTISIDTSKIVYAEGMSEYIRIHLEESRMPVVILHSLKNLIDELPVGLFVRIHRSYIVSVRHIASHNLSSVELKDGTVLPIGKVYREDFEKATRS